MKTFTEVENLGTNISYRCNDCRNCQKCKKGSLVEEISFKEEYKQSLIDECVSVDIQNKTCSAYLPFTADPDKMLRSNSGPTKKIYFSQCRRLAKSENDRLAIVEAEAKLQKLEFVDYLEDVTKEEQEMTHQF